MASAAVSMSGHLENMVTALQRCTWQAWLSSHSGLRRWPFQGAGLAHCNNFGQNGRTEMLGSLGA